MTSKQVLLAVCSLLGCALFTGCGGGAIGPVADPLVSPYQQRLVWAVAPLLNESGSLHVDGARFADQLGRQLETASNIDTLATNRTLAAMQQLQIDRVRSPQDAFALIQLLDADALVVGTVTDFDPYDPPKIGIAVELFLHPRRMHYEQLLNIDGLLGAAVDNGRMMQGRTGPTGGYASSVSGYFDAADPFVRERLQRYAHRRGGDENPAAWRRYRISTNLFTEFISYVTSWRLLKQEYLRLNPPLDDNTNASTP